MRPALFVYVYPRSGRPEDIHLQVTAPCPALVSSDPRWARACPGRRGRTRRAGWRNSGSGLYRLQIRSETAYHTGGRPTWERRVIGRIEHKESESAALRRRALATPPDRPSSGSGPDNRPTRAADRRGAGRDTSAPPAREAPGRGNRQPLVAESFCGHSRQLPSRA